MYHKSTGINEFRRVARYKINIQNILYFHILHISNKQLENDTSVWQKNEIFRNTLKYRQDLNTKNLQNIPKKDLKRYTIFMD